MVAARVDTQPRQAILLTTSARVKTGSYRLVRLRGTVSKVLKIHCKSQFWRLTLMQREFRRMCAECFLRFITLKNANSKKLCRNWSGRRGSNSQLSAWEAEFSILYFNTYKIAHKMCVHALHTVHAWPDLRVAAGRLRDGVSDNTV